MWVTVAVRVAATASAPTHCLFVRRHEARGEEQGDETPADRTLFVANLPVTTTEAGLRALFGGLLGPVEAVRFTALKTPLDALPVSTPVVRELLGLPAGPVPHGPGAAAYVVLEQAVTPQQLKALGRTQGRAPSLLVDDLFGTRAYLRTYEALRPDEDTLSARVDELMGEFEFAERETRKRLVREEVGPDADGFVPVTRRTKHARTGTERTGMVAAASTRSALRAGTEAGKKKKKKKGTALLPDFYRFQMREAKRNDIAELRRKFEEDKAKIAQMKAARKFVVA